MDKRSKTIDVVRALHQFQDGVIDAPRMIKNVCEYFDYIKSMKLDSADLGFLKMLANTVGIPHYFDHLKLFRDDTEIQMVSLSTLSSQLYESTLHTSEEDKVHRYQKQILDCYVEGSENRFFLSASTSFGKTHLVYEIIKKMKYKRLVLIFPTIALLSENLEKIQKDVFFSQYRVYTLSDIGVDGLENNYVLIYTPERFLSFLEKQGNGSNFDFVFIDEVYKIDNEYIIDEEEKRESERDISYRIAAYYSLIKGADVLLAGPYIESYSESFNKFLVLNKIIKKDFNSYEIVHKRYVDIKSKKKVELDEGFLVEFDETESSKQSKLGKLVSTICQEENCIIYCESPYYSEKYAKSLTELVDAELLPVEYNLFINHVEREYGEEWVVAKCLRKGVGIHHGLIPKYIQKEIISFFNSGVIKAITSTTTLTEGVNTSAKNLIVTNNKKGKKPLKKFDAKNIAGRAGRFDRHYSGRVIVLQNKFMSDIQSDNEEIQHKNYDLKSKKDEIDLFYSPDQFLTDSDREKRLAVIRDQEARDIPEHILDMYKVISRSDKIKLYDSLVLLDEIQKNKIKNFIKRINTYGRIDLDWDGFQIVLDCINVISKPPLKSLIDHKTNKGLGNHSVIVPMLYNYLAEGFKGLVKYKTTQRGMDIDSATRETAKFVYNTSKYQLVKYLGAFNLMYKFEQAKSRNVIFEEVLGIDRLLTKLEYNALTELGRHVSDYGVPPKVLRYYEEGMEESIISSFDEFERQIFQRVEKVVKRFVKDEN